MLSDASERRRVDIHKSTDGLTHRYSFDVTEPMPWRAEVDMAMCPDCFLGGAEERDLSPEESDAIAARVALIEGELQKSHNAWAFDQIERGAATLTESQLLERAKKTNTFAKTRLDELIRDGKFPQPIWSSGRKVWIEREAMDAIARVAAMDTEGRGSLRKVAPMNRYERRKLAARK